MWLNEKHIEEGLDHKNLREITTKYDSNHSKYRCELVEEPTKQLNRIFKNKKLAVKLIMDCRKISANEFKSRLGFKKCDFILTKKQSVLR